MSNDYCILHKHVMERGEGIIFIELFRKAIAEKTYHMTKISHFPYYISVNSYGNTMDIDYFFFFTHTSITFIVSCFGKQNSMWLCVFLITIYIHSV